MKNITRLIFIGFVLMCNSALVAAQSNCQAVDIDVKSLNEAIQQSIKNNTPYKLTGCFKIKDSIKIVIDEIDKNNIGQQAANIDMSEATIQVDYTDNNVFTAIIVDGAFLTKEGEDIDEETGEKVKIKLDHQPLEKSKIYFPKVVNITANKQACHYLREPNTPNKAPEIRYSGASTETKTANTGIEIKSIRNVYAKLGEISGFCTGLALTPGNSCSKYVPTKNARGEYIYCPYESVIGYNAFYNGAFSNNFVDVALISKHDYSWVNQNSFFKPTFLSDRHNPYCKGYTAAQDQQCKDIFIDGKLQENNIRKIDQSNNNSFFEPQFSAATETSHHVFSRAGNHNLIYKANMQVKANIGNPKLSNRVLVYGKEGMVNDCKGLHASSSCELEANSIKDLVENTLPDTGL